MAAACGAGPLLQQLSVLLGSTAAHRRHLQATHNNLALDTVLLQFSPVIVGVLHKYCTTVVLFFNSITVASNGKGSYKRKLCESLL